MVSSQHQMNSNGKRAMIESAQQELLKLQGSGRRLLEAIADAGDPASTAQKVIALYSIRGRDFEALWAI